MSESPGRNLALELVRVTEAAALAAARWVGRGDKESGDQAAVEAMRLILSNTDIDGIIVIGEGEKDRAPMLANGEHVGTGRGPKVDVAVDPVEGTSLLALGQPDSLAVVGVAPRGSMWSPGPAFYMKKLVVNAAVREVLSPDMLDAPVEQTLSTIAAAKQKQVADLAVFILDKPRHAELISAVRRAGARILLRSAGDVAGALMAARPGTGVDVLLGVGGTPEGVIAACAVKALNGAMLARLSPQSDDERQAVLTAGLDVERVLTQDDLVKGDQAFFAATGITDGVLLEGVRYSGQGATTSSLVMRSRTGTVRTIRAEHRWEKLRSVSEVHY